MAQQSLLTQHIESFVDTSRSVTQQAASLDAIVTLLKKDVLTVESLVREMGMYLTTTDDTIRARGILLLGEALAHLSSKPLDNATVHSLIAFFKDRLADWRALRGALIGCLALLRRKSAGIVIDEDAKGVAESYLENLQVQSLGQFDRKLCFELLECLLDHHPNAFSSLGDDFIYGICEVIDGEKDPQCLLLTFHIVELLARLFPDPCGPVASYAGDIFSILGCYFPIHFTHSKAEDLNVERDELSRALMLAFSSTPLFEPFAVPLLLEKLSSSLSSAKVDSLKYLSHCLSTYGADRMAKHARVIWSSLKDAMYSSEEEPGPSFSPEALDGAQENEITKEALLLLGKTIRQNSDLLMDIIMADEEINMIFKTIASYKSYRQIPLQSIQKLHVAGRILHVFAKASLATCNIVFKNYFPRLLEALGLSVENDSEIGSSNDNCVISKRPNYGSLYLCVELLGACRDLIISSEDNASQCILANETWCCLISSFSSSLSKVFSTTWRTNADESAYNAETYLGVKGLEILATFPGGYSLVSKSTCDYIMLRFVSIITTDFDKTTWWKLALKALVDIGSFISGSNENEKMVSYMDIVVQKIVSLLSSGDSDVPFPLKLEAVSDIGLSGLEYMLKIVLRVQEVTCAKLAEVYVQGNLKSVNMILQLLECYADVLLPRIQVYEGFEKILLQFVVNVWNEIEKCRGFTIEIHEKELLDGTMKAMKLAVACCSVEIQNIMINKAYTVLLSSASLTPTQSLSTIQEMGNLCSRDEWILSLFGSVIVALRPQSHVPNIRTILHLFMSALLKGHVVAAQALGSLVNKLDPKSSGAKISDGCTFQEAMDIIFSSRKSNGNEIGITSLCLDTATSCLLQIHAIVGLAWIGKGLLMRGHEKVKDITLVFLECLLSYDRRGSTPSEGGSSHDNNEETFDLSAIKCAADAFQILMSDSEQCLNHKFHAIIRPLYKQRFFSTIVPILQPLIVESVTPVSRTVLYRAFAHVISNTPLIVVLHDAKKLIPVLVEGLTLLSKDIGDKDIMYSLLLVLTGILMDKTGQEAVLENAHIIIKCLLGFITYPHMMLVRETSIQCLVAMLQLPHARIYPMRKEVLKAVSKALDDPKRVVRHEAVRCRQAWTSIA